MARLKYSTVAERHLCESDHLYFNRFFFKARQGIKFRVNWHHHVISDAIQSVIEGAIKNLVINVPPGSSKTEMVAINLMARGLALNPRSRFLHLSYSDDLASLNSKTTRDIVLSDEFQALWPMKIADDSNSKKRWNVEDDQGKPLGGVYATSLGGQVTGFRAGHMTDGFSGAIIIDDPLKPEDAFSKAKLQAANRRLLTTVKSRRANPDTPIVLIMQRISEEDPTGFIKSGNISGDWTHLVIPALIDESYVKAHVAEKYHDLIDSSARDDKGRFSYWPYKEPLSELLAMERGEGSDTEGSRVSRFVFASQWQQNPVALGGNIIRGESLKRYTLLPKLKYRKIFADTAQKTKERNDYSVFECWGEGVDGCIYLVDMIRGKWEAPELQARAIAFWRKHAAFPSDQFGNLREMKVEDKSSGTGLIQTLKIAKSIPVVGVERNKDKLTRCMDALPYIDSGMVYVPEDSPWVSDFISECEAFTADDTHKHDDQVDPMLDAVEDMLSSKNILKLWESVR